MVHECLRGFGLVSVAFCPYIPPHRVHIMILFPKLAADRAVSNYKQHILLLLNPF